MKINRVETVLYLIKLNFYFFTINRTFLNSLLRMFYLSNGVLERMVYVPPEGIAGMSNCRPYTKIRIRESPSIQNFIVVVKSISIINNKYAKILFKDSQKEMYIFLEYLDNPIVNYELDSFTRLDNEVTYSLLEGSVISIEEFHHMPLAEIRSVYGGFEEDYVFSGENAVKIDMPWVHVVVLDQCSILGHIENKCSPDLKQSKKRKLDSLELGINKELFLLKNLNNLIRNTFWRVEIQLIGISQVKEWQIKDSDKIGSFQRFLLRDKSINLEMIVFNELRKTKQIQNLTKVILN
jgi:hypothetical protein